MAAVEILADVKDLDHADVKAAEVEGEDDQQTQEAIVALVEEVMEDEGVVDMEDEEEYQEEEEDEVKDQSEQ